MITTFHTFLRWILGFLIAAMLIYQAIAHFQFDEPTLNVIPGKACGLQTEMRYLEALGKYFIFLSRQICT